MRTTRAIAAFLTALCAACTSSSGGTPTMSAPHTTVPITSPPNTSMPPTSTSVSPPPGRPTVPADVPRTGPNTRKGEKPPVMPLAATQHSAAGAQAFAEFFIRTIDWGYATTSSAYMRHYFARVCATCSNFSREFDDAQQLKQHFVGARISTSSAEVRRESARPTVAVSFSITAFERLTRTGKVVAEDRAHGHERFDITCAWRGKWVAVDMALET